MTWIMVAAINVNGGCPVAIFMLQQLDHPLLSAQQVAGHGRDSWALAALLRFRCQLSFKRKL